MKKIETVILGVACLSLFGFANTLQAGPTHDSARKFWRGYAHLVSSPFQMPRQIIQTTVEGEPHYLAPFKGMTAGLGLGAYHFVRQGISGFYDLFTFAHPGPPLYESEKFFPEL